MGAEPHRPLIGADTEVGDGVDLVGAQGVRWVRRQSRHGRLDGFQPLRPGSDNRVLGTDPESKLPPQVVQLIKNGPTLALQPGDQIAEHESRRDAVLVPDGRPDGVSECLFVAKDESALSECLQCHGGVGDPLEAGQGDLVQGPSRFGDVAKHRAGDDRVHDDWPRLSTDVLKDVVAEQDTYLVPRQWSPSVFRWHDNRQTIGVRIVGDDQVGVYLPCKLGG